MKTLSSVLHIYPHCTTEWVGLGTHFKERRKGIPGRQERISKVVKHPSMVWLSRLGHATSQKVAGSTPGLGTCLGCGPSTWLEARKSQPINASL